MDARVLDLFGSGNEPGSSRPQVVACNNGKPSGHGLASKKANAKANKKARARFSRSNFKPSSSNNAPYLPPEVSRAETPARGLDKCANPLAVCVFLRVFLSTRAIKTFLFPGVQRSVGFTSLLV